MRRSWVYKEMVRHVAEVVLVSTNEAQTMYEKCTHTYTENVLRWAKLGVCFHGRCFLLCWNELHGISGRLHQW